jgi:hypothetical protein
MALGSKLLDEEVVKSAKKNAEESKEQCVCCKKN